MGTVGSFTPMHAWGTEAEKDGGPEQGGQLLIPWHGPSAPHLPSAEQVSTPPDGVVGGVTLSPLK